MAKIILAATIEATGVFIQPMDNTWTLYAAIPESDVPQWLSRAFTAKVPFGVPAQDALQDLQFVNYYNVIVLVLYIEFYIFSFNFYRLRARTKIMNLF